jgi:transcriptional regulator NrdR family protein
MPVVETRKMDQIVIRIRVCGKCEERVRTQETTSEMAAEERARAGKTVEGYKAVAREKAVMLGKVMEAISTLKNIREIEDGLRAKP